jgi:GT2 family glycosyltransferase/glycosyltransferase involved in cell wall biosynthesis
MLRDNPRSRPTVSIIVPVFNKLAFTRQCLDRVARHTSDAVTYEVIVVDNGSTDGTREYFDGGGELPGNIRYQRNDANLGFARANNAGAAVAAHKYLLLLNNDTLVQPGWLEQMVALAESDASIGIVGIKQLFPYTNTIHHTGIMFTAGGRPVHIYPHTDAALPHVNKQREYQAVNGACLLIERALFEQCGGLDEGYRNGYEDIDLCMAVRQRKRRIVCCTSAFIYHYGQISDTRTADDDRNAAYFASKWGSQLTVDEADFARADARDRHQAAAVRTPARSARVLPDDAFYLADDLSQGTALTWINAELAPSLAALGLPVHVKASGLASSSLPQARRRELEALMLAEPPVGGVQIKWSHYWPQHLALDLTGSVNLEFFVINYLFGRPGSQPWDYWLQCVHQNRYAKLPLSSFCRDVLLQVGVPERECHTFHPGYSREIDRVVPPSRRRSDGYRFLTVTNSHDLERYGTTRLLEAYWQAFAAADPVVLVVKDYGAASGDATLHDLVRKASGRARVELVTEFTTKEKLIGLYKSCDAFVAAHRGEGYGMKLLDALACGLPVIAPLFGGPTDYCTPSNCFPVEYSVAPMGDCLDTRSLRITNQPLWCEPDVASLAAQLRAIHRDPAAARALGQRAKEEVTGRFTWDAAARSLVATVARVRQTRPASGIRSLRGATAVAAIERSPYWLGLRVSVVVPTYNRKEQLLRCLAALERQSILPQEFEVVVVDDGSTDGTEGALRDRSFPFRLQFHRQPHQGPGAARNLAISKAQGELVLFIGDDIIADQRLLENHLLAHAKRPDPGDAVLGHIAWPPLTTPTAVMDYVCGVSSLQFAYHHIPALPSLDYRFFYTSNISLKRTFLVEAADTGIQFDSSFRSAAFEDSELAYRLEPRGLRLSYAADALVHHDHWMDLESFSRREYAVGQMAVVFYRKHPRIDDQLQVRWIADWVDAVDRLAAQPDLLEKVRTIDAHTDSFFTAMAQSLEDLLNLERTAGSRALQPALPEERLRSTLHAVLGVIFDVQRTRGKVHEWYAGVEDHRKVDAAKTLLGSARKLDFLTSNSMALARLQGSIAELNSDVVTDLRTRVLELERELGTDSLRRPGIREAAGGRVKSLLRGAILRKTMFSRLRAADAYLQEALKGRNDGRLAQYQRVRARLRRMLF